jgi:hypothetical protein
VIHSVTKSWAYFPREIIFRFKLESYNTFTSSKGNVKQKSYLSFLTSSLQMCDSSRVNMVRELLRPYDYQVWAQCNWVLVRIWQGCGFAFRYHKSPHLLRKLGPKLLQERFSLINQSLSMCFLLVVTFYERLIYHWSYKGAEMTCTYYKHCKLSHCYYQFEQILQVLYFSSLFLTILANKGSCPYNKTS